MGFEFTANEWLIVGLAALFGLLLGVALAAGGGRKHKTRARDEARRADELQRENERLRREVRTSEGVPVVGRGSTVDADRRDRI